MIEIFSHIYMSNSKINFSHDPGNILNAFLSMTRNFFVTTSISVAILGLGVKSMNFKKRIFLLSLLIMMFSIIYGIKTTYDFNDYLNFLRENKYFKNNF